MLHMPVNRQSGAEPSDNTCLIVAVDQVLKLRALRAALFNNELLSNPAWDMLLHLYAAGLKQRRISVSEACNACAVPQTTALRWLQKLSEIGLVRREDNLLGRRHSWVELTDLGRRSMNDLFRAIALKAPTAA